jgi:type II secretory pathway pseudopilin PulG
MLKQHQTQSTTIDRSSQGFTLVELIAGIAMTLTVGALALQALSNTQTQFSADTNTIERGQKLSSVLDIISRDIRQAGEQINEARFPVIQVVNGSNGTGSRLILYRALSEPLPYCSAPIAAGSVVNSLITSSVTPAITAANASCAANFAVSSKQSEWQTKRTTESRGSNLLLAVVHDLAGGLQPFVYSSETIPTPPAAAVATIIPAAPFTTAQNISATSIIYIVEKREYLICNKKLKVWVDGVDASQTGCPSTNTDPANLQTIAGDIERLDITTSIRTPQAPVAGTTPADVVSSLGENDNFPTTATTWQNIQGLKIKIRAKLPDQAALLKMSAAEKLKITEQSTVEGKFYPRNILSARRAS